MEFKKEKVYTPLAATPTHNVSQAIKYGNLVFVSGMVGEDENEVLKEGLEAQCEQAFINMKNVLEAAGSSLEKVLFCQIFISYFNPQYGEQGGKRPRNCSEISGGYG